MSSASGEQGQRHPWSQLGIRCRADTVRMVEPSLSSPMQRFLPTAMRVYGLCFALAPASFYWIPAAGRWEPFNVSYERMFTVMFFAWGLCLFWAADAPAENRAIVRFSALQGILHGGVMLYDAFALPDHLSHLAGDVFLHLSAGIILGLGSRGIENQPRSALPHKLRVGSWLAFLVIAVILLDAVFLRLSA